MRMNDKDPYAPVPMSLKSRLSEWTTLFVGYSLLDYNLRLLFKTLRWQIDDPPMMYSVDYPPDELIVDVWDNQLGYVKFIVQDAWSVVGVVHLTAAAGVLLLTMAYSTKTNSTMAIASMDSNRMPFFIGVHYI